jgi:hypothetical protein
MKAILNYTLNREEMREFVMVVASVTRMVDSRFNNTDGPITMTEIIEFIEERFSSTDSAFQIRENGDEYFITMNQELDRAATSFLFQSMVAGIAQLCNEDAAE